MSIATLGTSTGTVTVWDDDRGLGEITSAEGAVVPVHCTAIADGTRTIEVGTPVTFRLAAGRAGRWEAWTVTPSS